MLLSLVIPAYNEEQSISKTVMAFHTVLSMNAIPHEILVVNDHSKDNTLGVLEELQKTIPELRYITNNPPKNGFGYAIRKGLEHYSGDCVAIVMADLSDSPDDLVSFYRLMQKENCDCVFGTRFSKGGKTYDYPVYKLIINRIANKLIQLAFGLKYNDCTNAFKLYKRETIEGLQPLMSPHFNLTVELPLKAVVRGYSYKVLPNSWSNRKFGKSNLKIQEMGSRYFFIMMYCLIEKYFSRGDFKKKWD